MRKMEEPKEGYVLTQTIVIENHAETSVTPPTPPYLKRAINLASYLSGAAHGFCDAQQIPLADNTELALTFGPTVTRALYSVITPVLILGGLGAAAGAGASLQREKPKALEAIVAAAGGGALGTGVGVAIGGTYGAIHGAVRTTIGYCFGYTVGSILPKS